MQLLRNFPSFYGTESSLPYSKEASTGPYPETDQSNPYHSILFSKIHFNIVHPLTSWSSRWSVSFGLSHQYPACLLMIFRNTLIFYGEELLAQRPTLKLEDHSLSAVRDWLFSILAAILHTWRASPHPKPEDGPCHGDKGPT
jgi:hypothetical protein